MRIALLGSAPSSIQLAPFSDPSWTIWACSPGSYPHLARVETFFELHRWEPHQSWFHKDYVAFMAGLQCPVYMIDHVPVIPNSRPYPKDEVLQYAYGQITGPDGNARPAKFDPNAFGSSLSWMLALAIMQQPEEIGLWGVDMAADQEYGPQKDGCLSLINVARQIGVKVTVPPESDLLRPTPLYGFREVDPMFIKLQKRVEELTAQLNAAEQQYQEANQRRWFFKGALDDALYTQKTWVADPIAISRMYENPEPPVMQVGEAIKEIEATFEQNVRQLKAMSSARRRKTNGTAKQVSA